MKPAGFPVEVRVRGPGSTSAMRVLKFGGSSLATPDRVKDVGRIVQTTVNGSPAVVVVSAFQGITNQLIEAARLAERRNPESCLLYTSPSPRDRQKSRMPSSA